MAERARQDGKKKEKLSTMSFFSRELSMGDYIVEQEECRETTAVLFQLNRVGRGM